LGNAASFGMESSIESGWMYCTTGTECWAELRSEYGFHNFTGMHGFKSGVPVIQ